MARCLDRQLVRGQIGSHYPQARVRVVAWEDDPLRLAVGEQTWSLTLRSSGPEYVPLRTFQDRDLLDPGSDPLLAPLGALSGLEPGERDRGSAEVALARSGLVTASLGAGARAPGSTTNQSG